jgi:hypothetical protein
MKFKEYERGFRKEEEIVMNEHIGDGDVTPAEEEMAGAPGQDSGRPAEYARDRVPRGNERDVKQSHEVSQEGAAATGDAKRDKFNELFDHINNLQDEIKLKDETIQEFTAIFERLNADSDQWQQQIAQ